MDREARHNSLRTVARSKQILRQDQLSGTEHDHQGETGNEDVHRLIHVAHDCIDKGEQVRADKALDEAEALATQRGAHQWLAQIALTRGVILDHSAQPQAAIPYFERALRGFEEEHITRMVVNASVFLGNMLAKTGRPTQALRVLRHALELTESPSDIEEFECAYNRFSIYREIGLAHRFLGNPKAALDAYIRATEVRPVAVGKSDTRNLSLQILRTFASDRRLQEAASFGTDMLSDPIGSSPEDWMFLAELQFEMGLIYLQMKRFTPSITASKQATDCYFDLRDLSQPQGFTALDLGFLGRLYVNTGTAHGQLYHVETAVAYWRRGLEILEQMEAPDATVPRDNLAQLRASCRDVSAYTALVKASEPIYQQIRV